MLLPNSIGTKFNADGGVLRFPGNTVICHIPPDAPAMAVLRDAFGQLQGEPLNPLITALPVSSYHMTVFEGVCDMIRVADRWPRDLPLDEPLDAVTSHFKARLAAFDLDCPPPLRLRAAPLRPVWGGSVLALEPIDAAENVRMRRLRDRLADALQLRTPRHDDYVFHITLGYVIAPVDGADEAALTAFNEALVDRVNALGPIELGRPEFCHFDDMHAFHPLMRLGEVG